MPFFLTGCESSSPSSGTSASTPCNGTTEPCPLSMIHAELVVEEITFLDNHVVEQDTLGDFPSPEWVRGRSVSTNSPVCYTRNKPVKVDVKFKVVRGPSASEVVTIQGEARAGSVNMLFSGSVNVSPSDSYVTLSSVSASNNLPNEVDCLDMFDIKWKYNPANTSLVSAGNSSHLIYVTFDDPSGTPPYWTLLDISCRAAAGEATEAGLVSKAYAPFQGRALNRKRDGRGLTYWNPDTTTCTNTRELLAHADGSGQCGSWSELLIDMFKCHGITSAAKIYIGKSIPAGTIGFLVKDWNFIGSGTGAAPWTHIMGSECVDLPGVPGQRNPNPPGGFFNHFIVLHDGQLYDPSYGSAPVSTKLIWENGAIDGCFKSGRAGFQKATYSGTNLLRFYNLVTRAYI